MNLSLRKCGLIPSVLLAAFVAAQFGTLLHGDSHDAATADQPCPICVAASQLASASVAEAPELELDIADIVAEPVARVDFLSIHSVPARQRGPPA